MGERYQRGSLRREGTRWILRRRVDGSEQRLAVGPVSELKTPGAARKAADALLESMAEGARAAGERITLERYTPFFIEKVCAQKKPSTRETYASVLRSHLLPKLGREALTRIDARALTRLVSDLEADGLAPRTVRLAMMVLARMLRTAKNMGYATVPPDTRSLRLDAKRTIGKPRRIFTLEQAEQILQAAAQPWRALYALLAFAGLRSGEALGLAWPAIDFDKATLTIGQAAYQGKIQTTKTAESAVMMPISERLIDELRAFQIWWQSWCAQAAPLFEGELAGGLLFPSPRDLARPYWSSAVRRVHFSPLLKRLGIPPAGLHAFRHTFATELFRGGAAAPTVQQLMRHSDIKTTLRYTQLNQQDLRDATEAFGKALRPI